MNTDMRLAVGVFRHPKILRLKRTLGADGVISLMTLWAHTAECKPNGVLAGMTVVDISIAAEWNGDATMFVSTLRSLRLLDKIGRNYAIHGWRDHNEYAFHAPARSEKAKKAAAVRWGGDATSIDEQCPEHRQAMPGASSGNAPSPIPSPIPIPDPPPTPEIKDAPGEHAASAAGASAHVVDPLNDNGASNEEQRQLQQQHPSREVILAMSHPDLADLWQVLLNHPKSKAPDMMTRADLIGAWILPKCGYSRMTQQEREQVDREDAEREAAHRESVVKGTRRGRGGKKEADDDLSVAV